MTLLRQRMTEDMQVRNFSPNTQSSYLQQVSSFARYFERSPALLLPEDIRSYQVYLTNEKKLSPSSIHVCVSALRFLYGVTLKRDWIFDEIIPSPKAPKKLPIVLSPAEVLLFLGCVESVKHRTILTACYAAGLRISEAVHLKPNAIDRQRMVIRVEQGKGQKDRYVMLSPKLLETLIDYWRIVRPKEWLFPGDIRRCFHETTGHKPQAASHPARPVNGDSRAVSRHRRRPNDHEYLTKPPFTPFGCIENGFDEGALIFERHPCACSTRRSAAHPCCQMPRSRARWRYRTAGQRASRRLLISWVFSAWLRSAKSSCAGTTSIKSID